MRVVGEDGGEAPLTARQPAAMVADALAVVAAAESEEADTAAARAIVRAVTSDVLARLEGATTVTVHDVATLVEAALIAAGVRGGGEGARPAPRAAEHVGAHQHRAAHPPVG